MHNNKPHTLKDEARLNSLPTSEPSERTLSLVNAFKRGLCTWAEVERLNSEPEPECTCTPDLPDGRAGYVCEPCRAEMAGRDIEF